jgi:hypothetical protein
MHKIDCPNCKKEFELDPVGYADIKKQVRDEIFAREVAERVEENASKITAELEKKAAADLRALEDQINNLKNDLKETQTKSKRDSDDAEEKRNNDIEKVEAAKEIEIAGLRGELNLSASQQEVAVNNAVSVYVDECNGLKISLSQAKHDNEQLVANHKAREKDQLDSYKEKIEHYKDMKIRLSTKMVGESLEQHCEDEFNTNRAMAFPRAVFEKDNDTQLSGTKGDFIFRDFDEHGTEIVSIMFEMKNESEETVKKQKNEDFFKKLNKDRNAKGCEYAILVSMLEADSVYYNAGIVDISHQYKKTYVVRPQFFLQIITLLRNASQNSLEYKTELALVKEQNLDVTTFEDELETFRSLFNRNTDLYNKNLVKALAEIDKSIKHLENTKQELSKSDNQLRLANTRLHSLSVKKLTKNSPTVAAKFAELNNEATRDSE